MRLPEIISYLLTVKYPGSESSRSNWVCYLGTSQIVIPLVPPGSNVAYALKPLHGSFAWICYATKFSSETVPNTFSGSISQFGSVPYSGVFSQRYRDEDLDYLAVVTEQEPVYINISNISPLNQKGESLTHMLVISSPQDLDTVMDALRRLHTTTKSEELLQESVYLLGVLSGQPQEPRPPVGGS